MKRRKYFHVCCLLLMLAAGVVFTQSSALVALLGTKVQEEKSLIVIDPGHPSTLLGEDDLGILFIYQDLTD